VAVPTKMKDRHLAGRPLIFKTAEELEEKIDEYFRLCDEGRVKTVITKDGKDKHVKCPRPYTLSGLAVHLGVDRTTLVNYSNRDEFFNTIRRARQRCENYAEEQLFEGNDRGAKFSLINNYRNWSDKQEVQHTGKDGGPIRTLNLSALSDVELETLQKLLTKSTESIESQKQE